MNGCVAIQISILFNSTILSSFISYSSLFSVVSVHFIRSFPVLSFQVVAPAEACMYFWFNPIYIMYANVYLYICMLFWHGDGAMVGTKINKKTLSKWCYKFYPCYFMKFSAKLIVLKSYCETSLSTTSTTVLSTASSFDIVVFVYMLFYIVMILLMYIVCMCVLVQFFFICLFTIYPTFFVRVFVFVFVFAWECVCVCNSHFCIHKSSTQPVNNGFMDMAFQNSSIIDLLKLLKGGWEKESM